MTKNKKNSTGKGAAVITSKGAAEGAAEGEGKAAAEGAAEGKGKGGGKGKALPAEGKGGALAALAAACPAEGFEGLPKVKAGAVAGIPEVKGFQIWRPPFTGAGAAFKDGAMIPAGGAAGFVVHCVNMARRFLVIPDKAGKAAALAAEVVEGKAAAK